MDTGYLIGVPDIIWEICQVQWGRECGGKSSLERSKSWQHLLGNIFSTNGNDFTRVRACLNPIRRCGTGRYGTRLSHSHNVPHRTPGIGLYSEPDQAGVMVLLGGWLPVQPCNRRAGISDCWAALSWSYLLWAIKLIWRGTPNKNGSYKVTERNTEYPLAGLPISLVHRGYSL